jgi:hypothetical protein
VQVSDLCTFPSPWRSFNISCMWNSLQKIPLVVFLWRLYFSCLLKTNFPRYVFYFCSLSFYILYPSFFSCLHNFSWVLVYFLFLFY